MRVGADSGQCTGRRRARTQLDVLFDLIDENKNMWSCGAALDIGPDSEASEVLTGDATPFTRRKNHCHMHVESQYYTPRREPFWEGCYLPP